ncbi:DNA primase regulatory subunit PriL [Methanococcoides sp. FTZ1]|uniref:DNA primase regulatory subunit PriL n=1 Tax=Methanococcoides sp. FTZ1 TaxID=3439061 RepID=UPI003F83A9BB
MESRDLALYPFVSEASEYVGGLGFSPERLLSSRALDSARMRGKERVIQSLTGDIEKPSPSASEEGKILTELLSYPFARILVSCIDDQFLIRKYALAEAKAAYRLLKMQRPEFLQEIGLDFSINADTYENEETHDILFDLHFTDYIRLASPLKDLNWKLVNRKMKAGHVRITREEFARLLQEAIRVRIQNALPLAVPEEICEACTPHLSEINETLEEKKSDLGVGEFQKVESELFPPCIVEAIAKVRAGVNLAHSMRFAMTSFLLNIGMSVDEVVAMFNVSPDFDEEKTRYQIEHIAGSSGTTYKPPSCNTMRTYGNCYNPDEVCKSVKHPLGYYSRRMWFKNRMQKENEKEA